MSETGHSRWRDELAAYLLGSLSDDEAAEVERHIEGCRECRKELRWLRPALEVLPESVEPLQPSRDLRARIMAEVEPDARSEPAAPAAPKPRRFRLWALRPAIGLAAAAAAAVGVVAVVSNDDNASRAIETIRTQNAVLQRSGDSGTLELTGLHQLAPMRVYEAWVQSGTSVRPSSLFESGPNGKGSAAIPHGLDTADRVMVTVEPRGGSAQPTSAPVRSVNVN